MIFSLRYIMSQKGRSLPKKQAKPELLAPAGTIEAFLAALEAGADAIYISPKILNARAYGKNFTVNQIADLTVTAHKKGVKVLVALNSLMKEEEIPACMGLLSQLDAIGVDALIIQDLGILNLAKKHFPSLKLHASTLMTIHNSLGVETCRRLGFSRVVLARELTLSEIKHIARNSRVETEVFVHGAMCFSVSGLCRFSSFFGGKSSTRGKCVQPCRRMYKWQGANGTFFSMDDLCGLEFVPELSRAGVTSLKIEGRLKPATYVYQVVRAYRLVLDSESKRLQENMERATEMVKEAMGRPLSKGFFMSQNPRDLISPTRTANTGIFLGKVSSVKDGWLRLSASKTPSPGDRLRIVLKERDRQFTALVKEVSDDGSFTLGKKAGFSEGNKDFPINCALVFKTDSAKTGEKPWSCIRLEKFKDKALIKEAGKLGKELSRKVTGNRTIEKQRGVEPEIFLFLNHLREARALLKQRYVKGFILPLTQKNLGAAKRLGFSDPIRKRLVWHLPVLGWERDLPRIKRLVREARNLGFSWFQVSNLWHLALPLKGARLSSSYELNVLNSKALAHLKKLGISLVQFDIETDIENLKKALSAKPGGNTKAALTIYGFIPLFTTRLRHRTYSSKEGVKSRRGESFYWRAERDRGYLYPQVPVSFLDLGPRLLEAGVDTWVVDLRYFPGKKRKNLRLPSSWKGLKARFRGRSFNMRARLE